MQNFFYGFGEGLLILAFVGLLAVLAWVVMTALHVKNQTVGHAKRLSQRPAAAVKNLITTVKGLVQQEAVRVKHIGASVKDAVGAVQHSASEIKEAAHTVHPEELKPAMAGIQDAGERFGEVAKALRLAAQLAQAAAKQKAR